MRELDDGAASKTALCGALTIDVTEATEEDFMCDDCVRLCDDEIFPLHELE